MAAEQLLPFGTAAPKGAKGGLVTVACAHCPATGQATIFQPLGVVGFTVLPEHWSQVENADPKRGGQRVVVCTAKCKTAIEKMNQVIAIKADARKARR